MTAQQLRNSILQQAIQGRLVPQDPNDEPASVLLERIKEEQHRLLKVKEIKKKDILFDEISESDNIFEIPSNWKWVRLKELFHFINGDRGKNYPSKDKLHETGPYPFISAINIKGKTIDKDNLLYLNQEQYDALGAGKLKRNDIVLCIRGSLGKSAIYPLESGAIASSLVILRKYSEDIDTDYALYYIQSPHFFVNVDSYDNGTAQPNLSADNVANFSFPLPPLAEQRRIVAKIEELMPLVEKYGKAQSELDNLNASLPSRLRQSILQEAIQGKLVEQDEKDEDVETFFSQLIAKKKELLKLKKISKRDFTVGEITDENTPSFDIPDKWRWIKVGDLFKHSTGKALNEANKRGKLRDYITTSNVYWNSFKLEKLRQMYFTDEELDKCQATKGDLLVLEGGDIGRAAIWNYDHNICLQNHIHKLRGYMEVETKFYYYCFQLYHDCGLIGGKGIGIQGLSYTNLHELVFPLPPLAEQRRIVAKIEELFAEIDKLK